MFPKFPKLLSGGAMIYRMLVAWRSAAAVVYWNNME